MRKVEARSLAKQFPFERVKLFYLVRSMEQVLRRPAERHAHKSAEQVALSDLDVLGREGLGGEPNSIPAIDALWKKLHIAGDWRKPDIRWIEPGGKGPLNRVSRASSELRDRHMVDVLLNSLKPGQRVLAMVGASHVVMQEPPLRKSLPTARITKLRG
ncbi:MAG: hypothetical protein QOJ65_1736 [Fimbriimonadaceae bacterium]|jgi:hypothetical protein|nr:hypothetical protein [Fimbriimonadaceae bacterium]